LADSSESVASLEMTDAAMAENGAAASADLARAPLLAVQPVDPRVRAGEFPNRIQFTPVDGVDSSPGDQAAYTGDGYSVEAQCLDAARAIGAIEGLGIVEQDQDLFEVYRFEDGSTAVLSRLDCDEVDS
jgi:hypothetical protein